MQDGPAVDAEADATLPSEVGRAAIATQLSKSRVEVLVQLDELLGL